VGWAGEQSEQGIIGGPPPAVVSLCSFVGVHMGFYRITQHHDHPHGGMQRELILHDTLRINTLDFYISHC